MLSTVTAVELLLQASEVSVTAVTEAFRLGVVFVGLSLTVWESAGI